MLDTQLSRAELTELAATIDALEFGTCFRIDDGQAFILPNEHAPSVYHDPDEDVLIESDNWETVSDNLTGQYGYNGAVMHSSEFIGAQIAERLVEFSDDFSMFASVVVEVLDCDDQCESDCEGDHDPAGWAIIGKRSF